MFWDVCDGMSWADCIVLADRLLRHYVPEYVPSEETTKYQGLDEDNKEGGTT
jgi:hypothetical protein